MSTRPQTNASRRRRYARILRRAVLAIETEATAEALDRLPAGSDELRLLAASWLARIEVLEALGTVLPERQPRRRA